ncbi:MAG: trypsin-like peptidase domain-containing protein [Ktedonobacteraceae bacterium]|nr:trypsin-like peptidase domain-containing protein [Ktedonobacteraceae bacterium]
MTQTSQTSGTFDTSQILRTLSNQMADAVERISPALVLVDGRSRQPASGFVYEQNLILTASHVLERDDHLTIRTHDGRVLAAQLAGRDAGTDLAVLRVTDADIEPAQSAAEEARVGQLVMAVGRTAEGPMASSGVVSIVNGPLRTERGATIDRYIRTDAIPYPGFSGGPLINVEGHVLGLLTTGLVNGIALALPYSIARGIADILARQGQVKRGYLGISSQFIDIPATQRVGRSREHGLLLLKVDENSPAHRGSLLVGDILIALDGQSLNDTGDLHRLLVGERVGKTVPVEVIRGTALQTLQVTIEQRR